MLVEIYEYHSLVRLCLLTCLKSSEMDEECALNALIDVAYKVIWEIWNVME